MISYLLIIIYMATMCRLSGSGFGNKWDIPWLPEALFSIPFGVAFAYGYYVLTDSMEAAYYLGIAGAIWTYIMMQSGTWYFLRWEGHDDPNTEREGKLKPIIEGYCFSSRLWEITKYFLLSKYRLLTI